MEFETRLVDALYVNWAVPRALLPAPPAPLELDAVLDGGVAIAFVTLVLFRQRGLHSTAAPWLRLEFPQCNLRLPVRDADRVPSVLLVRQLVPGWVVPLGRWIAGQPVSAATLRSRPPGGGLPQRWEVTAGQSLVVAAEAGAPAVQRPSVGGWEQLVAFFRERPRAYLESPQGMTRVEASFERAVGMPCRVEVERADWLAARLPQVPASTWGAPHSAFHVPLTRLELARASRPAAAVVPGVPAPTVPA